MPVNYLNSLSAFESNLIRNPWINIYSSIKVNHHHQTSIIKITLIVNDAKSFMFSPRYGNSPGCSNTVINRNEILYQLHELMKRNERKSRNRRLDDECSVSNDEKFVRCSVFRENLLFIFLSIYLYNLLSAFTFFSFETYFSILRKSIRMIFAWISFLKANCVIFRTCMIK